jgi:hypothetical protein
MYFKTWRHPILCISKGIFIYRRSSEKSKEVADKSVKKKLKKEELIKHLCRIGIGPGGH